MSASRDVALRNFRLRCGTRERAPCRARGTAQCRAGRDLAAEPDRQPGRRRADLRRQADLDQALPNCGGTEISPQLKGNLRAVRFREPSRTALGQHGRKATGSMSSAPRRCRKRRSTSAESSFVTSSSSRLRTRPRPRARSGRANEPFNAIISMTDSQSEKFWWIAQNGEWTLQLRPASDAADSPDGIETSRTLGLDGLRGNERRRAGGQ